MKRTDNKLTLVKINFGKENSVQINNLDVIKIVDFGQM